MKRILPLVFVMFVFVISSVFAQTAEYQEMIDEMGTVLGFMISLITMPYFVMFLVLVLFIILFNAIIQAALSSVPLFANGNEKQLRTISLVLSFLMTLGLLGAGGVADGSWSPENFQQNIARMVSPFGTISPFLLGFLIGALVYFSVSKNNPNLAGKAKFGWALVGFGSGIFIAASSNIRHSIGSPLPLAISLPFFLLGLALALVPAGNGVSVGGGNGFLGRLGDAIINRVGNGGSNSSEQRRSVRNIANVVGSAKKRDPINLSNKILKRVLEIQNYLKKEVEDFSKEYNEATDLLEKIRDLQVRLQQSNPSDFESFSKNIAEMAPELENMIKIVDDKLNIDKETERFTRRLYRNAKYANRLVDKALKDCQDILKTQSGTDSNEAEVNEFKEGMEKILEYLTSMQGIFGQGPGFMQMIQRLKINEDEMMNFDKNLKSHLEKKLNMLNGWRKDISNLKRSISSSSASNSQKKIDSFISKHSKGMHELNDSFEKIRNELITEKQIFEKLKETVGILNHLTQNLYMLNQEYGRQIEDISSRIDSINSNVEQKIKAIEHVSDYLANANEILNLANGNYKKLIDSLFVADKNSEFEAIYRKIDGSSVEEIKSQVNKSTQFGEPQIADEKNKILGSLDEISGNIQKVKQNSEMLMSVMKMNINNDSFLGMIRSLNEYTSNPDKITNALILNGLKNNVNAIKSVVQNSGLDLNLEMNRPIMNYLEIFLKKLEKIEQGLSNQQQNSQQ